MFSSLSKMPKEHVEEKQLCFTARDGTAYAGEIMQLSEGAGEGCFATLVRTGYDKYALLAFKIKIIAHDG
jgi:hypothetical protein